MGSQSQKRSQPKRTSRAKPAGPVRTPIRTISPKDHAEQVQFSEKGFHNALFNTFSGIAFGAFMLWVASLIWEKSVLGGILAGMCGLWGLSLALSGIKRLVRGEFKEVTHRVVTVRDTTKPARKGQAAYKTVIEEREKKGSSKWTIIVTIILVVIGYQVALFGGAFVAIIFGPVIGSWLDKKKSR